MIDKDRLTKRYYSITEVAKMFDVTNSLLRYWEGEFKTIAPIKGRNGIRRYTKEDIEKIEIVYDLLKTRGFTIEGARKELKKPSKKASSIDNQLKSKLVSLREKLKNIRTSLDLKS